MEIITIKDLENALMKIEGLLVENEGYGCIKIKTLENVWFYYQPINIFTIIQDDDKIQFTDYTPQRVYNTIKALLNK